MGYLKDFDRLLMNRNRLLRWSIAVAVVIWLILLIVFIWLAIAAPVAITAEFVAGCTVHTGIVTLLIKNYIDKGKSDACRIDHDSSNSEG